MNFSRKVKFLFLIPILFFSIGVLFSDNPERVIVLKQKVDSKREVCLKSGKEVASAKQVGRLLHKLHLDTLREHSGNKKSIRLLVLFDFDGVLFPLSGSGKQNFDPVFTDIIKKLKECGVLVGGLTHRIKWNADDSLPTFKALFEGFNLPLGNPARSLGGFSLVKDGVCYVGHALDKGEAMLKMFEYLKQDSDVYVDSETTVVFVDDLMHNLKQVEKAFLKCPCKRLINIHYTPSSDAVKRVSSGSWWGGFFVDKYFGHA